MLFRGTTERDSWVEKAGSREEGDGIKGQETDWGTKREKEQTKAVKRSFHKKHTQRTLDVRGVRARKRG